jgi:hypothetical protein
MMPKANDIALPGVAPPSSSIFIQSTPGSGMWKAQPVDEEEQKRDVDLPPQVGNLEQVDDRVHATTSALPPGGFDLALGGLREGVSLDGQLVLEIAHAENLDPLRTLLHEAALARDVEIDHLTGAEAVQVLEVQGGVLDREAGVGEAALGQPAVDGHLTAFEAKLAGVTRARLGTLGALAGGLAMSRADPAPDSLRLLKLHTDGIHVGQIHDAATSARASGRPRSFSTCSRVRSALSPTIVALARLMGLVEP